MSAINQTSCRILEIAYLQPCLSCDRCQRAAPRCNVVSRTAIDLDLDQPILLSVSVGVHYCAACHHYFRAQPPFLRVNATYSRRVVQKAIDAVHQDGMAMRCVPDRLARDFWVAPSEGMVRQWCKAYQATCDFEADYQPWVVNEFSGILCVDEVYQDQLALLLAVDPAAPDGDRLVGYQLIHGAVNATKVEAFLTHLREIGIQPDEVISDGAALYPAVLARVWPAAAHQLCLFHVTRHVTHAALEVIQTVRATLPHPPARPSRGWQGPLRDHPPCDRPEAPAYQRWQQRRVIRQAGIARVHELTQQGWSQRAIARHLGLARPTGRRWQKLKATTDVPADIVAAWNQPRPPSIDVLRHAARQSKREQVQELAQQGGSYSAIAREVGLHRVTVKRWLQEKPPTPSVQSQNSVTSGTGQDRPALDERPEASISEPQAAARPELVNRAAPTTEPPLPPAPWTTWEQVTQVREALQEHRFLLLRRPEHLNTDEQAQVQALLDSPVPQLHAADSFLVEWYALWKDEHGDRRTPEEAKARYDRWRSNPTYLAEPPLRRVLAQMTDAQFERLSPFLRHPEWEATNNGAERFGRTFRHGQSPHFNLRTADSISGSLAADACRRKGKTLNPARQQASRATRGRKRAA